MPYPISISESTFRLVPTVRRFCRICTSVCGILVDVEGDDVVRVRGDRERPLSKGYTCPKGRALPQMHHHPDRIERPQMRVDGVLQDTSWAGGGWRPGCSSNSSPG